MLPAHMAIDGGMSVPKDSEPAGAPAARIDHFLTVMYDTTNYGPPHAVTVRSSVGGWQDVPMTSVEAAGHAIWSVNLKAEPDQGPITVEFKLVLDGERWMAGWNRSATLGESDEVVHLDDGSVEWET